MTVVRSLIALLAGLFVVVALSIAVDEIMHSTGVIPRGAMWNPWHNVLALAYRSAITIEAAWLTARIAPSAPMRHAIVLGLIGTALGVLGVVLTWNLNLGPHWYPIALAVTALPLCWLGGRIAARRAGVSRAAA
jgi:hypothetical protein